MTRLPLVLAFAVAACHTDPGECKPGDATFSTLRGTVTTPISMQPIDLVPGATGCTVETRPSGDRDADVSMRTTVDLQCLTDEHLGLTFEIDDLRVLEAGTHTLDTGEYGLRISYRPTEGAPECYTYLADTDYQVTITEAAGEFAPYPELVTSDFHRRFDVDLSLALHNRSANQYTNGVVSDCSLDFTGGVAFSATIEADDYQARATDSCILE